MHLSTAQKSMTSKYSRASPRMKKKATRLEKRHRPPTHKQIVADAENSSTLVFHQAAGGEGKENWACKKYYNQKRTHTHNANFCDGKIDHGMTRLVFDRRNKGRKDYHQKNSYQLILKRKKSPAR